MDKLISIQSKYLNSATNDEINHYNLYSFVDGDGDGEYSEPTKLDFLRMEEFEKFMFCLKLIEFSSEKYLKLVEKIPQLDILKEYVTVRIVKYSFCSKTVASIPLISVVVPQHIGFDIIDKLYSDDTICAISFPSTGLYMYNKLYRNNCNHFDGGVDNVLIPGVYGCITSIRVSDINDYYNESGIMPIESIDIKSLNAFYIQQSCYELFNVTDKLCELVLFWGRGFPIAKDCELYNSMQTEYPESMTDLSCVEIDKIFFDKVLDIFAPTFKSNLNHKVKMNANNKLY